MAYAYEPSKWGAEFHSLQEDEALGAGAAGPGKSMVLLMDPLAQILHEHERLMLSRDDPKYLAPGQSLGWALHLRRTAKHLKQTIERSIRIFPQIDPEAVWSSTENMWTFKSGYKYEFGHCQRPNDWEGYMSNEYSRILFDELTQFDEEQYEQIKTRNRSSDPWLSQMLGVRSMTNPLMRRERGDAFTIKDPKWVYNYFVKPAPQGRVRLIRQLDNGEKWTRIYVPAILDDNPDKNFVKQYKRQLLAAKPHIRAALLYGDWNVTPDSYYAEVWDPGVCVVKQMWKIPEYWNVFRAMDWGFRKPGCVLWMALDPEENLWVFDELTFREKNAREVAGLIKEKEKALGLWSSRHNRSRITGPADNQLWEARGDVARSKAAEMSAKGISWSKADKGPGSRQANAERVYDRLAAHTNGMDTGALYIFRRCYDTIRTLPGIQTSLRNPEEPEDGGEDHWHDTLCYGVAYASRGRGSVGRALDDDDDDYRPPRNRGRLGYGA